MSWQPTALGRVQPVAELALAQTRRVIGRARLRAGAIQPLMEAYLESAGKLCVEEVRTADAAGALVGSTLFALRACGLKRVPPATSFERAIEPIDP